MLPHGNPPPIDLPAFPPLHAAQPVRRGVLLLQVEDGWDAHCPSLPGCYAHGATRAEAMLNIARAMQACLAALQEAGDPIPAEASEWVQLHVAPLASGPPNLPAVANPDRGAQAP